MLKRSIAELVLQHALAKGGDFAEIFYEDTDRSSIQVLSGKVESALAGRDHGAGIRVLRGTRCIYVYTNDTTEQGLLSAAEQAAAAIGANREDGPDIVLYSTHVTNFSPIELPVGSIDTARKVSVVKQAYKAAAAYDSAITQVSSSYSDVNQRITIANSEGLHVSDERTRVRLVTVAVAAQGGENQTGHTGPGGQMGFEFFDRIDPEAEGKEAARIAMTALRADVCPAGVMPVIIDNAFGGVLFHESCGHSLEATSVSKGQSVFCGKLGEKIASDIVTAIDDATIPNGWGSGNIDDEGHKTRRNVLIENGVLKSYLVDKLGGRRMSMASTGSGRRQSYAYAPTSRMSNTYIANGTDTRESILSTLAEGLYCAKMGGGSVNPVTGEFNFSVSEGYLVRNGQLTKAVRGATLIGKGSEILLRIDKVGNDMCTGQGMCGSVSGSIAADVGQPMIRISEMVVGGRQGGDKA